MEKNNYQVTKKVSDQDIGTLNSDRQFEDSDDIDILDLILIIWNKRKVIYISISVFFLIGLFHFMAGDVEYISEATLLRETERSFDPGLSFFQQFGIIGSTQQNLRVEGSAVAIPDIIQSVSFQNSFLREEITFSKLDTTITLHSYFLNFHEPSFRSKVYSFIQSYTMLLPITLYNNVRNIFQRLRQSEVTTIEEDANEDWIEYHESILIVDPRLMSLVSQMAARIEIVSEGNLIKSRVRMPDPLAAAETNAIVIQRIEEYLINNRIEKARQDLQFVHELLEDARIRYENAQMDLAIFRDENRGQLTQQATTELERLQNERNRLFNVYNNLSVRHEEARFKVQEETPVFTLFQKPVLPRHGTTTSYLVLPASVSVGLIFGVLYILMYHIFIALKSKLNIKKI